MKEIKMPSGAVLKVVAAPFASSKALYQAMLKELKEIPILGSTERATLYKDLFCSGFSSTAIEVCLWDCFKKCTYNTGKGDLRIDEETFEPVERREDYVHVCMEVAKVNVNPFAKSLFVAFQQYLAMGESSPI